MSFFGKLKSNATPTSPSAGAIPAKKDPNVPVPTALEKHLADATGPARLDGSDKFFGFENYSSTCYCNSIIQCLYYSAPFREQVISFPPQQPLSNGSNGSAAHHALSPLDTGVRKTTRSPLTSRLPPSAPGPLAANSPARKPIVQPGSPAAMLIKADEKDSPEYRKKMLMQAGPVLDMQFDYSDGYGMSESLFTAMKDIFEAVIAHPQRTGVVSPHKFLEILRKENEMFRSAMHQDAHEFLNLVLNSVVDNVETYSKELEAATGTKGMPSDQGYVNALNNAANKANLASTSAGWVHDLFEGLLTSETRCLTCENTSSRDEPFMDLSVDLEAHSSVTACLRKFSEEEMLCERNKFHCDNCGGLQEAEKRMKIKRLPRILALHLKRFKYTEDYNRLQKLFHKVVYPYHLRLFNTTDDAEDPDRLYELYAVVVHIGGGPYHGHYVSIIKTQDRGWLLFDDELVEPVDKDYVQNFFGGEPKPGLQDAKQMACAYVLFYQETTLEAVQREQEAENLAAEAQAAEAVPAVAVPTTPMSPGSFFGNGFRSMQASGVQTPAAEEEDQLASLAHAVTLPNIDAPLRPGFSSLQSSPIIPHGSTSPRTRKDTKKEEKERKAAEKEADKLARQQKGEALTARRERWKQSEDELKAAIEASKASKVEEDGKVSAASPSRVPMAMPQSPNGDKNAPLSRFRGTSLSLRQKPRWLGKDKENASVLPTAPEGMAIGEGGFGGPGGKEEKKSRFSLGRKKSEML